MLLVIFLQHFLHSTIIRLFIPRINNLPGIDGYKAELLKLVSEHCEEVWDSPHWRSATPVSVFLKFTSFVAVLNLF